MSSSKHCLIKNLHLAHRSAASGNYVLKVLRQPDWQIEAQSADTCSKALNERMRLPLALLLQCTVFEASV